MVLHIARKHFVYQTVHIRGAIVQRIGDVSFVIAHIIHIDSENDLVKSARIDGEILPSMFLPFLINEQMSG